jgi:AcrR family transcriptional regulator
MSTAVSTLLTTVRAAITLPRHMTAVEGSTPESSDGRPVRLDRAGILQAAERIVGSEGLDALTMRRIGSELGADPTAVYRHFRNKEALLTCLADRMFANEPQLDDDMAWQEKLRVLVHHHFERYMTHPDLATLLARQPDDLPSLVRIRDQSLQVLAEAGLTIEHAALMSHVLENHIVGNGLFVALCDYHGDRRTVDPDGLRRVFALLPADEAPAAAAAAPHLFPDPISIFDHTTELLIEAIERAAQADTEEEDPE